VPTCGSKVSRDPTDAAAALPTDDAAASSPTVFCCCSLEVLELDSRLSQGETNVALLGENEQYEWMRLAEEGQASCANRGITTKTAKKDACPLTTTEKQLVICLKLDLNDVRGTPAAVIGYGMLGAFRIGL